MTAPLEMWKESNQNFAKDIKYGNKGTELKNNNYHISSHHLLLAVAL